MANDYKQKEPSKAERMIYELAVNQQQMEKGLWSTSTVVMALAILTKVKPDEVAKLMFEDDKIKQFSQQVNEVIKKLEAEKHKEEHKDETVDGEMKQ